MEKSLKKCYYYMDLPFNATEEDVRIRETAMVRILKAKEAKKGVSYETKISKVTNSANLIVENIKTNGIPQEKPHWFETSNESIVILLSILLFVGVVCVCSFFAVR